jgi:hypothetical protein
MKLAVKCVAPDGGAAAVTKPCVITVDGGTWTASLRAEEHLPHCSGVVGARALVGADWKVWSFETASGRAMGALDLPRTWLFKADAEGLVVQTESDELRAFDRDLAPLWTEKSNGWLLAGVSGTQVMLTRGLELSTLDLQTGRVTGGVFETG